MKKLKLLVVFLFVFAFLGMIARGVDAADAYPTLSFTKNSTVNNLPQLYLTIKPISYSGGNWTYKIEWNRVRQVSGSVYIAPKSSLTTIVAKDENAPASNSSSPLTAILKPSTRYRLQFYGTPKADCDAGDEECVLIYSVYFNTLNENGQTVTLDENGNVIGSSSGSSSSGSGSGSTDVTSLQAQIDKLMALVQSLLAQLAAQGVTTPNTGTTNPNIPVTPYVAGSPATGYILAPANYPNGSGLKWDPCSASISNPLSVNYDKAAWPDGGRTLCPRAILMDALVISDPLGIASMKEPMYGYINILNPYAVTTGTVLKTSVTPLGALQDVPSQMGGVSTVGELVAATSPYKNGDFRDIHLLGTQNNKFTTNISYPNYGSLSCGSTMLKIERNMSLPPGLSYNVNCRPAENNSSAIIDGTISGTATTPGIYTSVIKTTITTDKGSWVGTTKIVIEIRKMGTMKVDVTKATDGRTSTDADIHSGDRVVISWNQSPNATIWNDIDIWAVQNNSSAFPWDATNKMLIATVQGDEGHQVCNNSTSGGSDPYMYGCGSYNWIAGTALGRTLPVGNDGTTYTIYVTPHFPAVDKTGQYLARLYGNCELGYATCVNYAWGSKGVTIKPATGTTSGSAGTTSSGAQVASFSQLDLYGKLTVNGVVKMEQSIGPHGTSNGQVPACAGGNSSGGVLCVGPAAGVNVKPGDRVKYEWKIRLYDPNKTLPNATRDPQDPNYVLGGSAVSSTIFVAGNNNFNDPDMYNPNSATQKRLRYCTSGIVTGGFDFTESQGYMNSQIGSYEFTIPSDCTDLVGKNIGIVQQARVYVDLNGGGSTWAGYNMGGVTIQ
jgi:hypothetical protein